MDLSGKTIDFCEIGAELGRGGMGTVYRAVTNAETPAGPAGTSVALKVFHPHLVADGVAFDRFQREAEIGQAIRHANVVRTYATGRAEVDGTTFHYLVLELVEGKTLEALLKELGSFPDHLLYQVADQILDGLTAIHAAGVVHRDLKPGNVVITSAHKVLLMDLGVARLVERGHTLTEQGAFVGSLPYAAPEQFDSRLEIGPACDLYAFGILLYELATGKPAYDVSDLPSLLQKKLQGEPLRPRAAAPDLDAFWDEVVFQCLQRDPLDRFQGASELRAILAEGEKSSWWHSKSEGLAPSGKERALKRLRLPRETPLFGRERERATLRNVYSAAAGGSGRLCLFSGPAGSGKSRLLYQFTEELPAQSLVLAGRNLGPGSRAYHAFVEAAGDLLGIDAGETDRESLLAELQRRLPAAPGAAAGLADFLRGGITFDERLPKDALAATLVDLFRNAAREEPVVLVLEDLHLAGAETLELLGYLARSLASDRLCVLASYQEDAVEDGSPLHEILANLVGRPGVERLALPPLVPEACDELVRAVVVHETTLRRFGPLLRERSDGNPYVLFEMLAHLKSTGVLVEKGGGLVLTADPHAGVLPSTSSELLALKLSRLDEEQRLTLEAAAVLGREFDASLLAAILEERRIKLLQRLAVLERKFKLLSSSGKDSFSFAGNQVRDAIYRSVPEGLRSEYHSIAADAILEACGAETPVSSETSYRLVHHLLRAGRKAEVVKYAAAAARHAESRYHASQAQPFLEDLAAALEGADSRVLFDVRIRQWHCYEALGRREEQLAVLEIARKLAEELEEPALASEVHCVLGATHWRMGDPDAAGVEAETALGLAREAGSREWEANSLHTLGTVARHRGEYETAARRAREALAIREEIGDRHGQARSLVSLGAVLPVVGEAHRALEAKEAALAIFRELGDRRGEGIILNNVGSALLDERRLDEAIERFQRAARIGRELGNLVAEAHPLCNLGHALLWKGRVREAQESFLRALALFEEAKAPAGRLDTLHMLGKALVAGGDLQGAKRRFDEGMELAERAGALPQLCIFTRELGTILCELGKDKEGWDLLTEAMKLAGQVASGALSFDVMHAMGTAALKKGDWRRAVDLLEQALERASEGVQGLEQAMARCSLARAYEGCGRHEDAVRLAREAESGFSWPVDAFWEESVEISLALAEILGEAQHEERARRLVEQRASQIDDPDQRARFLRRTRPAHQGQGQV